MAKVKVGSSDARILTRIFGSGWKSSPSLDLSVPDLISVSILGPGMDCGYSVPDTMKNKNTVS